MGSCVSRKQVVQINSNAQITAYDHSHDQSQRKSVSNDDSIQFMVLPKTDITIEKMKIKIKNQNGPILQKLQEKKMKKMTDKLVLN